MKILCVSDYVDPLIYNQNVKSTFTDVDLVLCAGDLPLDYVDYIVTMLSKPTYFVFGNHNLKDFHYYHKAARSLPGIEPINHSDTSHGHGGIYTGFKCIRDFTVKIKDPKTNIERPLLIAGASGSLKYNNGLNQYSDKEMKRYLIKMIPQLIRNKIKYGTYLDIFLTHASPRHIHDKEDPCHKGFECFNWFIKKFQPAYFVHGHIHLYDLRERRVTQIDDTSVVNAYAHFIIHYPNKKNDLEGDY